MIIEWDIEILACKIVTDTEEEANELGNSEDDILDDMLDEKYGVSLDTYTEIVIDLLPYTPQIKSPINGALYNAFVDGDTAIVKREVKK